MKGKAGNRGSRNWTQRGGGGRSGSCPLAKVGACREVLHMVAAVWRLQERISCILFSSLPRRSDRNSQICAFSPPQRWMKFANLRFPAIVTFPPLWKCGSGWDLQIGVFTPYRESKWGTKSADSYFCEICESEFSNLHTPLLQILPSFPKNLEFCTNINPRDWIRGCESDKEDRRGMISPSRSQVAEGVTTSEITQNHQSPSKYASRGL